MKANILPRGSMPRLTIQGQNIKTFNNSSIENVNHSNLLGKTLNNTIYPGGPNIKNAYSTSTINIGRSPNINKQNTITHIRQSNTTNKKNFDRNKIKLSSSGTLLTSKRAQRYNKVLKNGNKIHNIDINIDYEENQNEDLESVSTNTILKKKTFNNNLTKLNSVSGNLNNSTQNKLSILNNTNSQFNGNQLTKSLTSVKPKKTIKTLNPFARFINKILDKINPNINKKYYDDQPQQTIPTVVQTQIPEQLSPESKITPNKFSQNTISTNETNNDIIEKANNNINSKNNSSQNSDRNNNIQKITVLPVNKIPTKTLSNSSLDKSSNNNSNQLDKNLKSTENVNLKNKEIQSDKISKNIESEKNSQSIKKKEDDSKSKKSESKSSTNKFPFQPLNNLNSPKSKLSSNNTNKNPLNNGTDNYLITHLGEYMKKEAQNKPVTNGDLLKNNLEKGFRFCSELTQPGTDAQGNIKTDQDTSLISLGIGGIVGFNLFGILDGHGPHGHFVSQFCKEYFIKSMVRYVELLKISKGVKTSEEVYNELKNTRFLYISELFLNVDRDLASQNLFDCYSSGTTCNIVFQFKNHLVCFSVGDSRGILVYDKGDLLNQGILPLSTDHKPDLPGELERIQLCGGEVETMRDIFGNKLGPPRVYKAGLTYPGLAMSRSLGDFQAKECGVISSPQIIEYDINNTTKYIVICSDGVWEFISNEQVRDIGNIFYAKNDVFSFCSELIKYSTRVWSQIDIARDDITVVGVFF